MKKSLFLLSVFFILSSFNANAQLDLKHELGVIAGVTSIQSDYGERGDFASSYANIGFGGGLVYFISFDPYRVRWNDRNSWLKNHMRGRVEFSYMSTNFKHHGRYAEADTNLGYLLRGMTGSTKLLNYGGQVEMSIYSFSDFRKLEPYVSLGGFLLTHDADIESSYGNIQENSNLIPEVYRRGLYLHKANAAAITFGGGTRYTTQNGFKMLVDFRWQRFLSNRIDGIEPQTSADKHREWLLFLNFGVVFNLN